MGGLEGWVHHTHTNKCDPKHQGTKNKGTASRETKSCIWETSKLVILVITSLTRTSLAYYSHLGQARRMLQGSAQNKHEIIVSAMRVRNADPRQLKRRKQCYAMDEWKLPHSILMKQRTISKNYEINPNWKNKIIDSDS